jgi:hypothetical protein
VDLRGEMEDPVHLNKDFARVSRAETATIAMLISALLSHSDFSPSLTALRHNYSIKSSTALSPH